MIRAVAMAVLLALAACPRGAPSPATDKPGSSQLGVDPSGSNQGSAAVTDMTKRPDPAGGAFVPGAAVTPAAALIAWLDAQQRDGQPRLIRLPIVLARGSVGWSTRGAKIGGAADAVEIFVNDAALGIGLADKAHMLCKADASCAVWLVGYWRGKQDDAYQFDVVKIGERITADAIAAAGHAEVEGQSGPAHD